MSDEEDDFVSYGNALDPLDEGLFICTVINGFSG